ncbi:hypothetical protein ACOZ38_25055 [Sphaerisporangium viridialbum]|uniref:hypothetical protein n=1 Tax=Sphaerisporangium viridialbum TaxID=46189 RepID=UPI003C791EF9
MATKPTRREGRRQRFHDSIEGARDPKKAFHEAMRYLTAELADAHNVDSAEGARLYAHYAAELQATADEINQPRR